MTIIMKILWNLLRVDDLSQMIQSEAYPGWYMEMQDLGYNYRITDFQAALGC